MADRVAYLHRMVDMFDYPGRKSGRKVAQVG